MFTMCEHVFVILIMVIMWLGNIGRAITCDDQQTIKILVVQRFHSLPGVLVLLRLSQLPQYEPLTTGILTSKHSPAGEITTETNC